MSLDTTIATAEPALPQKPILEDYLARFPELGSLADLPMELIAQEYRVRKRCGDQQSHEEYLRRFPAQSPKLNSVLSTIDRESALEATLDVVQGSGPSGPDRSPPSRPILAVVGRATVGDRVRYFGDYELIEEIARGGMGVVFKARQVKLNRIVALKLILSGELAGQEEVQRFKTEAEAAANLDHPGIVPIYEIGEHNGQHYFSMGFVDGKSLADRVKDGPLPPREAAEILKKVAEAVGYAHSKGVVHRDLKPANVLLDAKGEPRVTDFGLAKQVQSDRDLTRTGAVIGTPSYMPPEQAAGKTSEVGLRSDVYSLGAILYCLLTGRPPFQASSPLDTLMQVLEKEPVSPRALNSVVPRDLETICLKCLQKGRESRYPTTTELSEDLRRFLNNEPIRARPVSKLIHGWKWCRRNPVTAILLALVFISALLMFVANTGWAVINVVAGIAREGYFRPKQVANDLKQLDLAIRNYHSTYSMGPIDPDSQRATETKPSSPPSDGPPHRVLDRLFYLVIQTQEPAKAQESELRMELVKAFRQYYEGVLQRSAPFVQDDPDLVEARLRLQLLERVGKP